MKRINYILFSFLLFIYCICNVSAASLKVSSNKSSVIVDDTFIVTVEASDADGWEYCIDYDSSLLTLSSSTVGDVGNTSCVLTGSELLGGDIVKFTFKVKKSGSTKVSLKNAFLYDDLGETINDASIGSVKLVLKDGYDIVYELNGGKNNSNNPSMYKSTQTIKFSNPTRTGYDFAGWYSDSKLTKKITSISKGSTGNKKVYAKWTAHKYSIKFNSNGATSGRMSTLTSRVYGKSYTLPANTFKKTGYKFMGWNTKKDGSGSSYTNKQVVKNLTSKSNGTVTLYAQWKKIKYSVTYNLNGGKNNSNNPEYYYVTSSKIILKNPTRKGYTFKGWYTDSKYRNKVTTIKKGSTGNKTLYAKWVKTK